MMTHFNLLKLIDNQNVEFLKSKMADGRHLENRKLGYLGNGFTNLYEI